MTYDACSAYVLYPIFTTDVAVDGEENPSEVARSAEVISMVPGDDAYCELRSFSSLYDILFYLVLSNISPWFLITTKKMQPLSPFWSI